MVVRVPGLFAASVVMGLAALASCQSSSTAPSNSAAGTATSTTDGTQSGSTVGTTAAATPTSTCTSTYSGSAYSTGDSGVSGSGVSGSGVSGSGTLGGITGSALRLTATQPDYQTDIGPLFTGSCATASCHVTGKQAPDLSTFAGVQQNVAQSLSDMQSGTMPPGGGLPSNAVQLVQTWQQDGMPNLPTDPGGSQASGSATAGTTTVGSTTAGSTTVTSTTTTTDPCALAGGSGIGTAIGGTVGSTTTLPPLQTAPTVDPYNQLLNPPAFTQCQQSGHVFDRGAGVCMPATIATSYQCNDQGVIQAFQKVGINVQPNLQQFESQGFTIDQCGELSGDPVVYFVFKDTSDPTTAKVQVKKLCKQGSPAC